MNARYAMGLLSMFVVSGCGDDGAAVVDAGSDSRATDTGLFDGGPRDASDSGADSGAPDSGPDAALDASTREPLELPDLSELIDEYETNVAETGGLLADHAMEQGGFDAWNFGNPGTHYDVMHGFYRSRDWLDEHGRTGVPFDDYIGRQSDLGYELAREREVLVPRALEQPFAIAGYFAYQFRSLLHDHRLDGGIVTENDLRNLATQPSSHRKNFRVDSFLGQTATNAERELAWSILAKTYYEKAGFDRLEGSSIGWDNYLEGGVLAAADVLYAWYHGIEYFNPREPGERSAYRQPFMLGLLLHALCEFHDHEVSAGRDPDAYWARNLWLVLKRAEGTFDSVGPDSVVEHEGERFRIVRQVDGFLTNGHNWMAVELESEDGGVVAPEVQSAIEREEQVLVDGSPAIVDSRSRTEWPTMREGIRAVARSLANMDGDGMTHQPDSELAGQPLFERFTRVSAPYPNDLPWDPDGEHWGFPLTDAGSVRSAPAIFGEIVFVYGWLGLHSGEGATERARYFTDVGDELFRSMVDEGPWDRYRRGKEWGQLTFQTFDYLEFRELATRR